MTNQSNQFRPYGVVLAAIVWTLLVVNGASASTTGRSYAPSAGGCCVDEGSCCCCEAMGSASRHTLAEPSVALATNLGRVDIPARTCECLPSEQPTPGRMPEQRPSSGRSDRDRGESVEFPTFVRLPRSAVLPRLILHADGLSISPLYLRNARLLI
jgi:hypothetical protein